MKEKSGKAEEVWDGWPASGPAGAGREETARVAVSARPLTASASPKSQAKEATKQSNHVKRKIEARAKV